MSSGLVPLASAVSAAAEMMSFPMDGAARIAFTSSGCFASWIRQRRLASLTDSAKGGVRPMVAGAVTTGS